jgi:hypothetical protein
MPIPDAADDKKSRLILYSGRGFDMGLVHPKRLGLDEVDPVLGFVGRAFLRIEFVIHLAI